MRLFSWNVNGLRAAFAHRRLDWLADEQPDVLCVQETRVGPADLPADEAAPAGYHLYCAGAERAGYSGVATLCHQPVAWRSGLGEKHLDREGRVLITEHDGFDLYNVYFPNGKASAERLAYKLAFYEAFLKHIDARVRAGRPIIFCGDINTAHRPIDLARPRPNEKTSGFLPEERAWLDRWLKHGWIDSFRYLYPEAREAYTWWSTRTNARARNIGWRLDYFFVHESLLPRVEDAGISPEIIGSDHCPVWLKLRD